MSGNLAIFADSSSMLGSVLETVSGSFVLYVETPIGVSTPRMAYSTIVFFTLIQKNTDSWCIKSLVSHQLIYPRKIAIELSHVLKFECCVFEFNHDIAMKLRVIKQRVNKKLVPLLLRVCIGYRQR